MYQATTRNGMRQNQENLGKKCSVNSLELIAVNTTEEKVSGVGKNRRTTIIITFHNHLSTHANKKTAELRNFNLTMT